MNDTSGSKTLISGRLALILGIVGLVLIFGAGAGTMWDDSSRGGAGCDLVDEKAPVTGPDLVVEDVHSPGESDNPVLGLDKSVCVTITGARGGSELLLLGADLADAEADRSKTANDLEQASEDATATPPADRTAFDLKKKDLTDLLALQTARLEETRKASDDADQPIELALFIDGKETPAKAQAKPIAARQTLKFKLEPNEDASSPEAVTWREVVGGLFSGGRHPVEIAVGKPGAAFPASKWKPKHKSGGAQFKSYDPGIAIAAGIGFLLVFAAIYVADRESGLLRTGGKGTQRSLARIQMAFWMIAVLFGFVFIWTVTGQFLNVVTTSCFTLMGISGATALASAVIEPSPDARSVGFFSDILSDGVGEYQLHRIQVFLSTLALGSVFLWRIADSLALTSFDANLLLLIGISNGIYAGLKTQEAEVPRETARAP